MVYYPEAVCHAEKLVHCLQCQGHSKGLYSPNRTISTKSSGGPFATALGLIVHHKPECPVQKLGYCIHKVKVTATVQNVPECLSR